MSQAPSPDLLTQFVACIKTLSPPERMAALRAVSPPRRPKARGNAPLDAARAESTMQRATQGKKPSTF